MDSTIQCCLTVEVKKNKGTNVGKAIKKRGFLGQSITEDARL